MIFNTLLEIPPHLSEDERLVFVIDHVVSRLTYSFKFGYHQRDDMLQEGRLYCLDALDKKGYDPERPLEKFLYRHVVNHFINFKRDKFFRNEVPCLKCPFRDAKLKNSPNGCLAYEFKHECDKYHDWEQRNNSKRTLANPATGNTELFEAGMVENIAEYNELFEIIEERIPPEYLSDFKRLAAGEDITQSRRAHLKNEILIIFESLNE